MLGGLRKTAQAITKYMQGVGGSTRGGWNVIWEAFAGAWQRNIEVRRDSVLSFYAIFSCTTLIASDIAKMRFKMERFANKVWQEIPMPKEYYALEKPNAYQTALQFRESWLNSKLTRGNAYIFLDRAANGVIREMHVLNPDLVLPLVSDDGAVFYQVGQDNLSGIKPNTLNIPASEIIHDRFNCLFHPLVGLSPIFAAGVPAVLGMNIVKNAALLFENMSRPSGILSVPGAINAQNAADMKAQWDAQYGANGAKQGLGGTAVLGDSVKYEVIAVKATDAQMVEHLRMTAEMVCSAYHVPKHKAGVGEPPSYNNIEGLDLQYLSQCLQVHIEGIEACLNESFETPAGLAITLDLDMLLRMDSKTKIETLKSGVDGGIYTPNEARRRLDLAPLAGGDTVYLQQQDYPMEVLAQRRPPDAEPAPTTPAPATEPDNTDDQARAFYEAIKKELSV